MRQPEFLILRTSGEVAPEPDCAPLPLIRGTARLDGDLLRVHLDGESFFVKGRAAIGDLVYEAPHLTKAVQSPGHIYGYLACPDSANGYIEVYVGSNGISFEYPDAGEPLAVAARFRSGNITVVSLPGGKAMYAVGQTPRKIVPPRHRNTRENSPPVHVFTKGEAIQEAIACAGRCLRRAGIIEAVHRQGFTWSEDAISQSISHLFRTGKIHAVLREGSGKGMFYGLAEWFTRDGERLKRVSAEPIIDNLPPIRERAKPSRRVVDPFFM